MLQLTIAIKIIHKVSYTDIEFFLKRLIVTDQTVPINYAGGQYKSNDATPD